MTRRAWWCFAAAVCVALAFRLAALDVRPMHHDEANQAIRFGQLLERGDYRYSGVEHHGPTLYYLTLPVAWLRGQATLASLDEWTLRAVPAVFGAATLLLLLPLRRSLGGVVVAIAALLLAVAPPLTYYSRYYIQESLLLFFSLGFLVAAGRYLSSPTAASAVWAGVCAGLAVATKETSAILLPAGLGAAVAARWWTAREERRQQPGSVGLPAASIGHVCLALGSGTVVAVLLFTSFFANPAGLLEVFRAPFVYAGRGVNPDAHRHPWFFYASLVQGGARWAGLGLLLIVVAGSAAAFARRAPAPRRFWGRTFLLYAAVCTAVFSALPYKTPWNLLPFYAPWLVLAAIGAADPFERSASARGRVAIAIGVIGIAAALGGEAWRVNFRYPADPRNPYAYVHTSPDVVRLADRVRVLASLHPAGASMLVAVVAAPSEQWPLPWYFRRMARVGYWTTAADAAPAVGEAGVVIASPANTASVHALVGDRYHADFYGLRPDVVMTVFVERSLWDRFLLTVQ
jgi:uncharacterized protein (TIGR03663 family)